MNRLLTKTLTTEAVVITVTICSLLSVTSADVLDLPSTPLIINKAVQPNMMLLLDSSGSMSNIVRDSPYDESIDYFNCPSSKTLINSSQIDVHIQSNGDPYLKYDNSYYDFGSGDASGVTDRSTRCFSDDLVYNARLLANSEDDGIKLPNSYLSATYKGNYLNWYFSNSTQTSVDNFGSGATRKLATSTRMEIAKLAASALIDDLSDMRVGLAIYNGSSGARIDSNLGPIETTAEKSDLKAVVNAISNSGSTPLGESLADLGRYFADGAIGNLMLHPDQESPESKAVTTIFDHSPAYKSGLSAPSESVVENWCQQNFIVAMTDGIPTNDTNVSSDLATYYDGGDIVDDVTFAMYDMDLRPDLSNGEVQVKNNVTTYMVGFADEQVLNNSLMESAANKGGGLFITAANSSELVTAFKAATNSIFAKVAAGSGAAFNTSQLNADSSVYAASFNSAKWSGSLQSFDLSDTGGISESANWNAATKLDGMDHTDRNIFSYNSTTHKGIEFNITSISDLQKRDLQQGPQGNSDENVTTLIDYLKGDRSNEGSGETDYRERSTVLGDIANSMAVYVGSPQMSWPNYTNDNKFGSSGNDYAAFKSSVSSRTPMLYVGANDGMLHGFNVDKTDADLGKEKLAYIPAVVASENDGKGLHYLAQNDYSHQFYVDLTPTISDVYVDSAWRTVLIGGLRSGGKGLFALDITDPTKFSSSTANAEALALWEFSSADDEDFGYSYSKPTVAMMENGKWAVIVGNGYNNSGDGHAQLFILYIEQGLDGVWSSSDYIKLDTGIGSVGTPNGLSTPRAVDLDGDKVVDRVYAGDLQGNMWAFDVSSNNDSSWSVAYKQGATPVPLFTALDSNGNAQPITTAPIIDKNNNVTDTNNIQPNILVFFGTGKYIEESDKTSTAEMSYYGIWDNNSSAKERADLTPRKLITSGNNRVISGEGINWNNTEGWYFDLVNRTTEAGAGSTIGERVISGSLIRNGVLLFTTAIPNVTNSDICVSNSESWLMAVDLSTGKAPVYAVFDVNGDGVMNDADTTVSYDSNADSTVDSTDKVSFGGTKLTGSMVVGDNAILGNHVYSNDVDGNLSAQEVHLEGTSKQGRLSWEERVRR